MDYKAVSMIKNVIFHHTSSLTLACCPLTCIFPAVSTGEFELVRETMCSGCPTSVELELVKLMVLWLLYGREGGPLPQSVQHPKHTLAT